VFELLRTKLVWLINAVFFIACMIAGVNLEFGLAMVALVFLGTMFIGLIQASETNRAIIALSVCLFVGFFHEPITDGRYIYFIQEGLLVLTITAVLLGRPNQPFTFSLAVFIPIFVFVGILTPISLLNEPSIFVLNGLRKWLMPLLMFFIGQLIYEPGMEKSVLKMLLITVMIQVPAIFVNAILWTGGSMEVPHPDLLSGTFGAGGTGVMAVLVPPVVVWGLWAAYTKEIPKRYAIFSMAALGILLAFCEIKLAIVMVPFLFMMLSFLSMAAKGQIKKMVLNPLAIIIPVIPLALLLTFGANIIKYKDFYTGFAGGVNIFNLQKFESDIDRYLAYKYGGVRKRWSDRYERDVLELSRYGMVIESIQQASKSPRALVFGYGLDSVTENALRRSVLAQLAKVDIISFQLFSFLLFEAGLLGLFAYLGPIVYFFVISLALFLRPQPGVSHLLVTGTLLLSFAALSTIFYNDLIRFTYLGGVFWFVFGMMHAHRTMLKKANLETT
jgi:hypothetical protein